MRDLRCMAGRHTGQREGGTMMFTCPRCRGSFWQTKDYGQVTALADRMIDAGQGEEAMRMAQEAVRRGS